MTYRTNIYFVCQLSIKCITVQDYVTCVYNGKKITIMMWKFSVYATLNNNECQILILIFAFYFCVTYVLHLSYFLSFKCRHVGKLSPPEGARGVVEEETCR